MSLGVSEFIMAVCRFFLLDDLGRNYVRPWEEENYTGSNTLFRTLGRTMLELSRSPLLSPPKAELPPGLPMCTALE